MESFTPTNESAGSTVQARNEHLRWERHDQLLAQLSEDAKNISSLTSFEKATKIGLERVRDMRIEEMLALLNAATP